MNESLNNLTAYVSVRSIGGTSLYAGNADIRSESIGQFASTPVDSRTAIGKLVDKGFRVRAISPISVRVEGPAKLFQKHFGLKFEKKKTEITEMYTPTDKTEANCLNLGSEVFEGMAFPQPIELHGSTRTKTKRIGRSSNGHNGTKRAAKRTRRAATLAGPSATPPALNYYHLNVPDDIATILNARPLHQQGIKGQGVKAAMIDSGFGWSHPYFQGKGYDLAVALPEGSDVDDNGHGTGESANFLAVAPKAKLFGLSMDSTIEAFAMCRQQLGVQIISNSWGSAVATDGPMSSWHPYWSQVLAEIALCVASGIIVMFSGGNGGMSATASSPDTISVGGVYKAQDGTLRASDYASSFDSFRFQNHPNKREVHVPEVCGLCGLRPAATYIALPIPAGCEIDRSRGGGSFPDKDETGKTDGWGVFSGTSAACPMTAGVVALILQQHPNATLAEVRQRLSKAQDVTTGQSSHGDSAGPGYDAATGYGLVDAVQAVA
jgi:subtilisin family serine protease